MTVLPKLITRLVGWAAHRFYQLDVRGDAVPAGPVMVVANHPNALLDPLIVFRTVRRLARPLAKEPLFRHPLIGPVLRALGGLPVYRRQDHPELMHQNEDTFAAAIAALRRGDAIQIYPEGQSHSEARLTPMKTGAARIALRAETESGWQLGLKITPIGLTYARKTLFRGRAVALVGESFTIDGLRATYESDPPAAVSALTDRITRSLEELTLNLTNTDDLPLIDTAERLYAREKRLSDWRTAERLGERVPRLQAFARGLAWLRARDPARHQRLARAVRRYRQQSALLGAGEADVPPKYETAGVAWYIVREAAVLGIGLPLALAGLLFWYPPYVLNRLAIGRMKLDETELATYKLGIAMVLMPLTWLAWVAASMALWGGRAAIATASALPILGLVLQSWTARWAQVKEDARLFLRVARHPRRRDRLSEQRKALVREFDDVAGGMDSEAR